MCWGPQVSTEEGTNGNQEIKVKERMLKKGRESLFNSVMRSHEIHFCFMPLSLVWAFRILWMLANCSSQSRSWCESAKATEYSSAGSSLDHDDWLKQLRFQCFQSANCWTATAMQNHGALVHTSDIRWCFFQKVVLNRHFFVHRPGWRNCWSWKDGNGISKTMRYRSQPKMDGDPWEWPGPRVPWCTGGKRKGSDDFTPVIPSLYIFIIVYVYSFLHIWDISHFITLFSIPTKRCVNFNLDWTVSPSFAAKNRRSQSPGQSPTAVLSPLVGSPHHSEPEPEQSAQQLQAPAFDRGR